MNLKNFRMMKYLGLLGGGMLLLSVANFILGISNYLAQTQSKNCDVLALSFGNPYFAAYQFLF
jgi:hypothetical protein